MKKKRIVILSGAGMSAESGLSTFRDANGLWNNHRIEEVASPEGFERDPALVLEFYNQRRRELVKAAPNEGHYGLVALEEMFDVQIVTQNVDNLHERAGSSSVIHLHGELMKCCSVKDPNTTYDIPEEQPDLLLGHKDPFGDQLRPFIVWFGEAVPMIEPAISIVESADILVIIGTSLQVYPAAGLIHYVRQGIPIYLIDPKEVSTSRRDLFVIQAGASEGVRILIRKLMPQGE